MTLTLTTASNGVRVPSDFWSRVASAGHSLLVLDYDEALAPTDSQGMEAPPPSRVLELIATLAPQNRCTVTVVSRRPVDELRAILGRLSIRMIGENGWQLCDSDGRVEEYSVPQEWSESLQQAAWLAASGGMRDRLTCTRASVRVRSADLQPAEARSFERACAGLWADLAFARGLLLTREDGGIELRAPSRSKGTAVRQTIAHCGNPLTVYVGNDEDSFRAVQSVGFGIQVGERAGSTDAVGLITSHVDVSSFLEQWHRCVGTSSCDPSVGLGISRLPAGSLEHLRSQAPGTTDRRIEAQSA